MALAILVGLGPAVWLVIMLVIMPLTSAGPFASALPDGAAAAILGYLAISLAYGQCWRSRERGST